MSASVSRSRTARSITVTIASALAGSLILAGCGGGDDEAPASKATAESKASQPAAEGEGDDAAAEPYAGMEPQEILALANEKAKKAKTVQVKLAYADKGGKIRYNMKISRAGRATGKLTVPKEGSMNLTIIGEQGYFRPGKDMLKDIAAGDQAVIDLMSGRWMEFSRKDKDMADMYDVMDVDFVVTDLVDLSYEGDDLVRVEGKKIAGRETIGLKTESEKGTTYIAADGSGELVSYQDPEASGIYTNWNKKLKIKAPADPISAEDLASGNF
ncbi:hypothetical protein LWF15_20425 [Kineosporia rhizophila]|uniref:hypothetical protein n=1 Tax=Kineosporia TaxID=49184 RepID=UPI001E44B51E|nr:MULTISPECIES: hypothetical protein [Kineosporia]MCE0537864.1 hypothetical protein [Kineosporia rhizophila]GLY15854.1 hypothetical protein Kisp01_28690 [Kineosporia sp. NBRC 101677]